MLGIEACITKFPLFKYDFYPLMMAPGYHFFQRDGDVVFQSEEISLLHQPGVLLHFKFIKPQFQEFVEQRIARNEDWKDSVEYRAYREFLIVKDSVLELYDGKFSQSFRDIESLNKFLSHHE